MRHKVYVFNNTLRKWFKVHINVARKMIENGIASEYCNFKTDDLKYTDLTTIGENK